MIVTAVNRDDAERWERMRRRLWPESPEDHPREIAAYFRGDGRIAAEVLLARDAPDGEPIGFVELSIRPLAEGCTSDRVAYLEGWFVEGDWRGKGVGRALVRAAEDWARAQGCTEFASDAEWENEGSRAAHRALGFEEAARVVCFRKSLRSEPE